MYDRLKTFIQKNKEEFDSIEPPKNLWTKIDTHMNLTQTNVVKSKWFSWLKYVGLSIPIIFSVLYFSTKSKEQKINVTYYIPPTEYQKNIPAKNSTALITKNNSNIEKPKTVSDKTTDSTKYSTTTLVVQDQNKVLPILTTATTETEKEKYSASQSTQSSYSTLDKGISINTRKIKNKEKTGNNILVDTNFIGVKRLEIDGAFFNINLQSTQTDKVLFHGEMNTEMHGLFISKMDCKIKYEQKDSILHVYVETKKANASVVFGSVKQEAFLNFDVPPTTDVVVNSSSGNINMSGLKGKICNINANYGNISIINTHTHLAIECASGNVSLANIKGLITAHSSYGNQALENTEGVIDLKNRSGDISIKNSKGNINLESNYGNQLLEDITGKITSKNTSGDLRIIKCTGDLTAFLTYGNLKCENIDGNVTAKSSSGDISIKMIVGDIDINATYGDVTTIDSKGNLLIVSKSGDIIGKNVEIKDKCDFSADYGDIKMNLKNNFNELSFDLKTNLGDLKVNKNGQKIKGENGQLFLNGGKIVIKGYTANGDQTYE